MKYRISKQNKILRGEITLPASKSISNRLLIIGALSNNKAQINNLSKSGDTQRLAEILRSSETEFDVDNAGTTMRFLTTFLANKPGEWILYGSERMHKRPIGILTNALKNLGVRIEFLEKEGFPPIKIYGTELEGGKTDIYGNISSQFVSSLLLVAPTFKKGLELELKSRIVSKPYIDMTLKLMRNFGVKSTWIDDNILIEPQKYRIKDYTIESDWSAASYWYEMAAFSDEAELILYGLKRRSIQGDSVLIKLYEKLGVKTTFIDKGVVLTKKKRFKLPEIFEYNLIDTPDLAQTLTVTLSILDIPFTLYGLDTLAVKETNRVHALKNELKKFNLKLVASNDSLSKFNNSHILLSNKDELIIDTYGDHRMAMAFAPVALHKPVIVDSPEVVSKSYPDFWKDLKTVGFEIEVIK